MAKYIGTVFAVGGDMTYPPDSATDGSVNLNTGYTPQYEIDLASGDPTAKAVERNVMNGLFNWLFDNQSFDQAHGLAPWFSTYSGGYPINAMVADNSTGTWQIYRSLKDANSDIPTLATSWELLLTQTEMLNRNPFALGGAKGSASGSIASGTNLNTWLYSQGTWVVTTDAIAANITNLPSSRQGVLIARNTTTNYNPSSNATGGSFFQMYFDADGKVYVRFYAVPSSGTTQTWTAWRTIAFLDSPAFTGAPTAPTAAAGTNTTQIASTEFVTTAVENGVTLSLLEAKGVLLGAPIVITSNQTYTPSANADFIIVEQIGGGAGGTPCAGSNSNTASYSGGGGAGAYAKYAITTLPSSVLCVIGAGGASGSSGGTTTFTGYCSTGGGSTGSNGTSSTQGIAGGGAGGAAPTISNATAIIASKGASGIYGICINVAGGNGGHGANSMLGQGGRGNTNGAGEAAGGYGAGGGGCFLPQGGATTAQLGGAGSKGVIIIYEYGHIVG